MNSNPFSASYAQAREKFLQAARVAGASLSSYLHPEVGPEGEVLTTDCAWIGPDDARAVLVLVSGTHGVEGFCGSGAQIDWLQRREFSHLTSDQAVLLVHALNPYGFAWKRRVTHENVDLNRNFIDFSKPAPQNPEYEKLAAAVKPTEWTEETGIASRQALLEYARTYGFPAMAQAISGGQYTHPDGVFYGGSGPTWSRKTLESIFATLLSRASDIGIVDYHTGLGPEGYAEPIITAEFGSAEYHRAVHWHGLAAKCISAGESASAQIAGDWLAAAPNLAPHAKVTGISLEYGTVEPNQVLEALRADNWLHAHGDPTGPQSSAIKAQLLGAFYVDTEVWRGMVLGQSLTAVRNTMAGLARAMAT